jgi:hypothetical protein
MNKRNCFYRSLVCCLIALSLLAITGCGAKTGDVTGTVTYQAKTVASGTVIIAGSDGLPYYGIIQDDGTYSVAKVPPGLAKIIVLSPGPDAGKNVAWLPQMVKRGAARPATPPAFRGDPKKWFPLPEKYREFETSGLTVTIAGGTNQRDIPLE